MDRCKYDNDVTDLEACVAEVNSGFSTDSYGYY
jgi:hypothetical protein